MRRLVRDLSQIEDHNCVRLFQGPVGASMHPKVSSLRRTCLAGSAHASPRVYIARWYGFPAPQRPDCASLYRTRTVDDRSVVIGSTTSVDCRSGPVTLQHFCGP